MNNELHVFQCMQVQQQSTASRLVVNAWGEVEGRGGGGGGGV